MREDKPTNNQSSKDRKKVQNLREKSLQYWRYKLPFEECAHYLTAVSCQFSRLKLKIDATKLIDNVIVHSTLKTVAIPMEEHDGASWAEYLSAVVSLVRLVMHNLDMLRLMTDIAKENDIAFASTSPVIGAQFREDSPESVNSNDSRGIASNSTSSNNMNWIDQERKLRILEKIDAAVAKFNEETDSIYVNPAWEDIFLGQQSAATSIE